ncbi:glycosyltransferase family 2 protein [Picrophilus oshimae]|uniref:Glycosyl transferase family 2 n=1 Tax=Picrophilus torridus (strain ATCC 700027 / DSM 9790 / JCM 10055 / NBRC 100828 / KAW 2/3) TaxID=1122961 RepID=A0A8G2FWK6_PICTO|nr:glycosyltransferase family 2 protein [Picrophilus oshimae]SMD30796.1 Glycosyl transferase family 2 [Picrophilus oshimae DSM 9789]
MEDLFISVIITAYNRKEFLLDAVKSALNQTLSKEKYEIIVIKNYNDNNIDKFLNKNNIKNIIMDGTIGEYLYKGINESKGDIISFLDDDDLFFNNKLEYVYNLFKKNNNLIYYHNNSKIIDKNGKITKLRINAPYFNMSSINIKKDIINIDNIIYYIKKISTDQDLFMYLCALESDKKIISNKMELTYYRYHNSTSNTVSSDIKDFNYNTVKKLDTIIDGLYLFKTIFKSKKIIKSYKLANNI